MQLKLNINNQDYTINAEPDVPLLWTLRDIIGLTGTKYGCGEGLCGACTVLIDNVAQKSCVVSVSAAINKKITTIEGLSTDLSHPLQIAWMKEDVSQCGYCQPGQIMSAAALLMKIPKPTDADIDQAMQDNICRCGTYNRIRTAIHLAAQ